MRRLTRSSACAIAVKDGGGSPTGRVRDSLLNQQVDLACSR